MLVRRRLMRASCWQRALIRTRQRSAPCRRHVKAYLKRGKNDANDAVAICEAVTRPSMRWNIDQFLGSNDGVYQALLSFETRTARCSAVLRLKGGRCWTLLTAVSELIGFEETTRARRTNGAPLRYEPGRPDWRTERDRQREELENLALESTRTIEIDEFVDRSEIDPRYLIRPYYLCLSKIKSEHIGGAARRELGGKESARPVRRHARTAHPSPTIDA
jgi:hypothetical protein